LLLPVDAVPMFFGTVLFLTVVNMFSSTFFYLAVLGLANLLERIVECYEEWLERVPLELDRFRGFFTASYVNLVDPSSFSIFWGRTRGPVLSPLLLLLNAALLSAWLCLSNNYCCRSSSRRTC
jgi:hypothetical protein